MKPDLVSIAHVSEETGIGIETLRIWERRYGRPRPVRLPSGHRRYTNDQIEWLRRVADAVAQGHRPSAVLTKTGVELEDLIAAGRPEPRPHQAIDRWIDLARRFAERELLEALRSDATRLGLDRFVLERVTPFLSAVGDQWRSGRIGVRHEHFASEILEEVLRGLRRRLRVPSGVPLVVMTTLSGEHHGLGNQIASVLFTTSGLRVRNLGTDTPNEEILEAARETGAAAVAVSVSLGTCGVETERTLADLREQLPERVQLIAGGQGARRLRRGVKGIRYFPSLKEFHEWLQRRPLQPRRDPDQISGHSPESPSASGGTGR